MKTAVGRYLAIWVMLGALIYLASTGFIMGYFGSESFFLHQWAGYLLVTASFFHLYHQRIGIKRYFFNLLSKKSPSPLDDATAISSSQGAFTQVFTSRRALVFSIPSLIAGYFLGRVSSRDEPLCLDQAPEWGFIAFSGTAFATAKNHKFEGRNDRYKYYPAAPKVTLKITGINKECQNLNQIVANRRSVRSFKNESISEAYLAQVLTNAAGITEKKLQHRAAPSAGALYPIEVYALVNQVEGMKAGLYHFRVDQHHLEFIKPGNLTKELLIAGIGQKFLAEAQVVFILTTILRRTKRKYKQQAYRYALLEAGHIAQNICLTATALGLATCPVGAFAKKPLVNLLAIDVKEELPIYIIALGRPS